jgi:hypothetical protein
LINEIGYGIKMKENYFNSLKKIDGLIQQDPTDKEVIEEIINLIKIVGLRQYFFNILEDPIWIEPLWNKGVFSNPISPLVSDTSIVFPPWPESRYLARMAPYKPELVMKIVLQIPDNGNMRVYEDEVDAALGMPCEISIKLLDKVREWLKNPIPNMPLPNKLGDLLIYYAKGQQVDAAFELATALFEIIPDSIMAENDNDPYKLPPEPKLKYLFWDYKENLDKCIPALYNLDSERTLEYLCGLLEKAIQFSRRKNEKDSMQDSSWIWRPAIEDHEQNHPHEFKNILVDHTRDVATRIVKEDSRRLVEVLDIIGKHNLKIFHRIKLYLLWKVAEQATDLVEKELVDQELFSDHSVYHEYVLLLKQCFGILSDDKQKIILKWIDDGPEIEEFKKNIIEEKNREPLPEEISKRKEHWQLKWLFFIKDHLKDSYKRKFEALQAKFDVPEHPDLLIHYSSWRGSTSPKTMQEFQEMPVEDLVKYLQDWKPEDDPKAPSPEGLANTLVSVVSASPMKYANAAIEFRATYPIYIRSVLRGLHDALNQKESFEWRVVLELCKWIIEQPIKGLIKKTIAGMADDRDWGNTRKAVADLVSAWLEDKEGAISIEYREIVWLILNVLVNDSDPTLEYENKYGGSNIDPSSMSINTTRGEAMHAVIRYALWIRREFDKKNDRERINQGLSVLSEVQNVLEEHLDVSKEPTLTIRAVYGQWFPWLVYLDKKWAETHASEIFPLEKTQAHLFFAAWDAYIIFCQAHDEVFAILKDQYAYAVDNLSADRTEKRITDPNERLAQHLMVLYWREKIEEGENNKIFERFWENASLQLRGLALGFIGRSLKNTTGQIPSKILDRLKSLWQSRLEVAKNAEDIESYREELKAFSSWFLCGKFSDDWTLANLYEVLKIVGETEMNHSVMKKLAELVKTKPSEVIACVDLIVRGDRSRWTVLGITDYLSTILKEVLKTEFAPKAEEIVNTLLSQGHFGFRDLLENRK